MSEMKTNEYRSEEPPKKKRSKLALGCGIGCGLIVLLVIIVAGFGYYLIKDTIVAFEETDTSSHLLEEKFGGITDYCPEPDGSIKAERMEAFLEVRESLVPLMDDLRDSAVALLEDIRKSQEKEEESFWGGVGIMKDIFKQLPQVARYFTIRNRRLMEENMGLAEYSYIYTLAYYSFLSKAPTDGPDFKQLAVKETKIDFDFLFKNKKKRKHEDRHFELRGLRFMVPMMKCQMEKLKESGVQEGDDWLETLDVEIQALEQKGGRLPWKDTLPKVLEDSLQPFRDRLEASYRSVVNPMELGFR
ncbi:MAG: hypothetical protein GY765_36705 [bacterium]|nr:hypothetical protein [bacterium]